MSALDLPQEYGPRMPDWSDDLEPKVIEYIAEPTASAFHNSPAFVRGLMGPVGSGKTVTCIQEIVRMGKLQRLGPDGKRRTRWGVIRNTYPELLSTTLQTFKQWFDDIATIRYSAPISAIVEFDDVWIEILFVSVDRPQDIKKLKSLELTGVLINEASEIDKATLDMATSRVGRYPAKKDGGPSRVCVIMDTNPPDDDHWWYELFEEEKPDGYAVFKQPPALLRLKGKDGPVYMPNPGAENIQNLELGYQYYLQMIPGKSQEWINVFVMGQYGTSREGRPCYPFYNDNVHRAKKPLTPYKGLPLLLGWDYGRTPACIIGQVSPTGQLLVLDEIVVRHDGPGMGIRKFTADHVKPYLQQHYPGFDYILSRGDPSGGAKSQTSEKSCFEIQAEEGIPTEPMGSNEIQVRLDDVEYWLQKMASGEPAFLLDPEIRILRKGFLGGYEFERVQVSGDKRFKDQPKKNRYSHPHDALQALADLARRGLVKGYVTRAQEVQAGKNPAGWT